MITPRDPLVEYVSLFASKIRGADSKGETLLLGDSKSPIELYYMAAASSGSSCQGSNRPEESHVFWQRQLTLITRRQYVCCYIVGAVN